MGGRAYERAGFDQGNQTTRVCPRRTVPVKSSATRMRRRRERAKQGGIFVRFEMTPAAVDRLIELRWLAPESRHDTAAVTKALLEYGTNALWPPTDQI